MTESRRRPRRGGRSQRGSQQGSHQRSRPAAPLNRPLGEILIDRISHDGRGIANWQGKTLFVENALPGERVDVRLQKEQGRYAEATAVRVVHAAPERQEPPCRHYAQCGGCQLQHMPPEQQLVLKQNALLEQLQRWSGLEPREMLPAVTSPAQGYRNRARLGVWYESDGRVTFGFRQRQSKALVDIADCLVLTPELTVLLAPLRGWLAALESQRSVTHIELLLADEGPAAVIRHTRVLTPADRAALLALAQSHKFAVWLQGQEQGPLTNLGGAVTDPRLHYTLPAFDLRLAFHPQDFIQVNAGVNRAMVTQALNLLQPQPGDRVLDLFCGIGNFTLPLARLGTQVIGVEAVPAMVARGTENAALNGLENTQFVAADLTRSDPATLVRKLGKPDLVLLDPPRDGARELIPKLAQLSPRRLVYVSCNPATLARDAKLLADAGYRLQALGVLDMFPHTAHVESMALFVRRDQ